MVVKPQKGQNRVLYILPNLMKNNKYGKVKTNAQLIRIRMKLYMKVISFAQTNKNIYGI